MLYAVLVSLSAVLILDSGFGVLAGHFAAVFAVGAVGALTYMLFAFACQEMAGVAGTGFAALLFIFIGIAVNGATTATPLLIAGHDLRRLTGRPVTSPAAPPPTLRSPSEVQP